MNQVGADNFIDAETDDDDHDESPSKEVMATQDDGDLMPSTQTEDDPALEQEVDASKQVWGRLLSEEDSSVRLNVLEGPGPFTIGRAPSSSLRIDNPVRAQRP